MQQGFCGGVSEAGFGNTGGKQRGEESEAVALRCGLLHSLVRGFVYDIPAGIGDGERNREAAKGSSDETDGERVCRCGGKAMRFAANEFAMYVFTADILAAGEKL